MNYVISNILTATLTIEKIRMESSRTPAKLICRELLCLKRDGSNRKVNCCYVECEERTHRSRALLSSAHR